MSQLSRMEMWQQVAMTFPYAVMGASGMSETITISASDTWYPITGLSSGQMSGFDYASNALTTRTTGVFKFDWSVSFELDPSVTRPFTLGVLVDGTAVGTVQVDMIPLHQGPIVSVSGSYMEHLAVGDTLQLGLKNNTATEDALVRDAWLTVLRVGA